MIGTGMLVGKNRIEALKETVLQQSMVAPP